MFCRTLAIDKSRLQGALHQRPMLDKNAHGASKNILVLTFILPKKRTTNSKTQKLFIYSNNRKAYRKKYRKFEKNAQTVFPIYTDNSKKATANLVPLLKMGG